MPSPFRVTCPVQWDSMTATTAALLRECEQNVHDVSERTVVEVVQLLTVADDRRASAYTTGKTGA